jgi:hypothetical protein
MMMMMTAPLDSTGNTLSPQRNNLASQNAKKMLLNLSGIFQSRKKSDHQFINWWLGTFVLSLITGGLYYSYREIRIIARRDSHFAKTHQFYTQAAEVINSLAKECGNTIISTDLRNTHQLLNSKETKTLVKPIRWWVFLLLTMGYPFVVGIISGILAGGGAAVEQPEAPSLLPYIVQLGVMFPILIYYSIIYAGLMKDYAKFDALEADLVKKMKVMLLDLGVEQAKNITFEPQCKPRKFWLHWLLSIPTLCINWLYVDYQLVTEPLKRFKEANRAQYHIQQALAYIAKTNEERSTQLQSTSYAVENGSDSHEP